MTIIDSINSQTSMAYILYPDQAEGQEMATHRDEAKVAIIDAIDAGAVVEEVETGVFRVEIDGAVVIAAFSDNATKTHGLR